MTEGGHYRTNEEEGVTGGSYPELGLNSANLQLIRVKCSYP